MLNQAPVVSYSHTFKFQAAAGLVIILFGKDLFIQPFLSGNHLKCFVVATPKTLPHLLSKLHMNENCSQFFHRITLTIIPQEISPQLYLDSPSFHCK